LLGFIASLEGHERQRKLESCRRRETFPLRVSRLNRDQVLGLVDRRVQLFERRFSLSFLSEQDAETLV
jgi:hypothetical protein